jgi:hypothetical protein
MGDGNDQVPQVSRALLRIEWADGQVREFDAQQPTDLDVQISRPDRLTEHPLVPAVIWPGDAVSVAVTFRANQDSRRHPFTIRIPEPRGPLSREV